MGRTKLQRRGAVASTVWFSELRALLGLFLNGGDVQSRDGHTAAIVQPHDNPAPLWIYCGVLPVEHRITIPSTRENEERLERARC
jgi:hypothetical protein